MIAPELVIVATDVLLLVHDTPPDVVSCTNPIDPIQTVVAPVTGAAIELTTMLAVL